MPLIGAERIAECGRPLVDQVIMIVRLETGPASALEQRDGESRLAQFLRDHAAARSGADHHRVHVSQRHGQTFLKRLRPRICG